MQNQSFEVMTFRMVNVGGMIGPLGEFVQHANGAPGFDGSGGHRVVKQYIVNDLRARKSKQNSVGRQSFESGNVEPFVGLGGGVFALDAFGKGRRIKHNDIVLLVVVAQKLKNIRGHRRMVCFRKIEFGVFTGLINRFLRSIHRSDKFGSGLQGIDRKASCVAKGVEYFFVFRE